MDVTCRYKASEIALPAAFTVPKIVSGLCIRTATEQVVEGCKDSPASLLVELSQHIVCLVVSFRFGLCHLVSSMSTFQT